MEKGLLVLALLAVANLSGCGNWCYSCKGLTHHATVAFPKGEVDFGSQEAALSRPSQSPSAFPQPPSPAAFKTIKFSATGYGTAPANCVRDSCTDLTPAQKKLMAIRASKLDAFRAIAEQVRGVRLVGNTTVSAMAAQNDNFRVFVDAYLRGVRVISVQQMGDVVETVAEVDVDRAFYENYLTALAVTSGCGEPEIGATGNACAYSASFYNAR